MASSVLSVSGFGQVEQFELKPEGSIIGRSPNCDITLDRDLVSRRHARIFQDPFGRWIIEDIGSRNGVLVCGEKKNLWSIVPGESIKVGPFSLSLDLPQEEEKIEQDGSTKTTTIVTLDNVDTEITSDPSTPKHPLALTRLKQLSDLIDSLATLTNPLELYPAVCEFLVQDSHAVALVLRFTEAPDCLSKAPDILASQFGDSQIDWKHQDVTNFHLSRKVLEAALHSGGAVMAKSIPAVGTEITLTLVDENNPRMVICAPLNETSKIKELLYLDMPMDQVFPDTFEFIRMVSRQVVSARRNLSIMQMKTERSVIDKQLAMARRIQSRLIPQSPPDLSGVDFAMSYQPAMWVGGDYCDVWLDENGKLVFVVGDVCGKGLPAAVVMSNLQAALRITMSFSSNLSEVMERINTHLLNSLPEGMFITMFLGVFDPSTESLEYVNAGHLQPLVIQPDGSVVPLGQPANLVLGIMESRFQATVEAFPKGTGVVIFSDGVTEAMSPGGEEYGEERLAKLLETTGSGSAKKMIGTVTSTIEKFRQSLAQQDDITVVGMFNRGVD